MYPIVASDMDGTLLNQEHTLSPYTRETLQRLTERGIHFIFATGRHFLDIAQIRESMGIDAFMITSNGARVHDAQDNLIYSQNLAPDIAQALYDLVFDDDDIQTHVYKDTQWYTNRVCPEEIAAFFQESKFDYQLFNKGELSPNEASKVFYISEHDRLLALEKEINERFGDKVNASFSNTCCLEVMDGHVSKGQALKYVAQRLGYSLADCIAFGDGMNDEEMLTMAAKGCIMENAPLRLKKKLPMLEVIGNNQENAVAKYLRSHYAVIG